MHARTLADTMHMSETIHHPRHCFTVTAAAVYIYHYIGRDTTLQSLLRLYIYHRVKRALNVLADDIHGKSSPDHSNEWNTFI